MANDDLIDENYLANAASQVEEEGDLDTEIEDLTGSEIDVPDTFFGQDGEESPAASEADQALQDGSATLDEDPTVSESATKQTYKADGQEYEIDLSTKEGQEEALRALSMFKGARKAFTKSQQQGKRIKKLEGELENAREFKKVWDQLEKIKDDPAALWETITGTSYDQHLQQELERRSRYQNASEEERKIMDADKRLAQIERAEAARQAEHKRRQEEFENREKEIVRKDLEAKTVPIFEKYAVFEEYEHNPYMANKMREMLWTSTLTQLERVSDKVDVTDPRVIEEAFRRNAGLMRKNAEDAANKKVHNILERKKKVAQEQAQVAATRNYQDGVGADLAKKDPMSLFQSMFRR